MMHTLINHRPINEIAVDIRKDWDSHRMLRPRCAVLGLVILLVCSMDSFARSQRPPNQQFPTSQQQAGPEQRGTEQAPFVVKIEQPSQAENKSTYPSDKGLSQGSNGLLSAWGLSDRIAAIAIFIGTLQFAALIATVCVMRRTAYRQLRAYISVEPWGINPFIGRSFLIGHIQIKNTGAIPATNVSIYSTIGQDFDGERTRFDLEDVTKATTALPPRAKMKFGSYKGWEIPAPEKVRDRRIELDGFLYVWGRVTYTDSFGTNGWTNFCHRYPCEMFGKEGAGPHSVDRRFGRYHEYGGNEVDA